MSILRVLFLGLLAFVLLILALANRDAVTLRLIPEGLSEYLGFGLAVTLPLFVVVFLAIGLGLTIGYVLEWLREHRHRRAAARERAERERLERELAKAERRGDAGDDVLALVERPRDAA